MSAARRLKWIAMAKCNYIEKSPAFIGLAWLSKLVKFRILVVSFAYQDLFDSIQRNFHWVLIFSARRRVHLTPIELLPLLRFSFPFPHRKTKEKPWKQSTSCFLFASFARVGNCHQTLSSDACRWQFNWVLIFINRYNLTIRKFNKWH